jgi:CheY-like chemotaxis protein
MNSIDFKIRTFMNSLNYLVEQFKKTSLPPTAEKTLHLLETEIEKFLAEIPPPNTANGTSFKKSAPIQIREVLIVDDNDINLLVLRAILDNLGISTRTSRTAAEVLNIVQSEKTFDCFFLDLQMPEIDGFDLVKRLRLIPALKTTPMLAVTALTGAEVEMRAKKSGFDFIITKPISKAAILNALSSISQ